MATKADLNFFDILPLEIRDKIYRLILAPTGYVAIDRVLPHGIDGEAQTASPDDDSDHLWQHGSPSDKFKVFFDYPFGHHSLKSFQPQNVRLSFLRTNRQIYVEAKHIFFRYNFLNIDARYDFEGSPYGLEFNIAQLPKTLVNQLENVHCNFLFKWEGADSMVESALAPNTLLLQNLGEIAGFGKLRAVELNVKVSNRYPKFSPVVSDFQDLIMFRQPDFDDPRPNRTKHIIYARHVDLLRQSRKGALKDVQRSLVFDFSDVTFWGVGPYWRMPAGFVPVRGFAYGQGDLTLFNRQGLEVHVHDRFVIHRSYGDPNIVLQELNNAFGGDLYVGSRLCLRKGNELSRPWHEIRLPWQSKEDEDEGEERMGTFFNLLRNTGEEWYEEELPLFGPASPSPSPSPSQSRSTSPGSDHEHS